MPLRRAAGPGDRASDESSAGSQQSVATYRPRERISFFTVPDVAEHLGVADRTVRRWIEGRQLVAHRFGRAVRISEEDLRRFLAAHRGDHP
jgi:excisionase family DNA binding protein